MRKRKLEKFILFNFDKRILSVQTTVKVPVILKHSSLLLPHPEKQLFNFKILLRTLPKSMEV